MEIDSIDHHAIFLMCNSQHALWLASLQQSAAHMYTSHTASNNIQNTLHVQLYIFEHNPFPMIQARTRRSVCPSSLQACGRQQSELRREHAHHHPRGYTTDTMKPYQISISSNSNLYHPKEKLRRQTPKDMKDDEGGWSQKLCNLAMREH